MVSEYQILSSKNKKPCGECPYLLKNDPLFTYGIHRELCDFDGDFTHNYHKLDPHCASTASNLGCVGSKLFGER